MSARAKNALRRRARIAVVSGLAFVAALVTFVLIPRRATRVATAVEARIPDRPDSQPTLNARIAALATISQSDSLLALTRRQAAQAIARSIDTLPFYLIPRRDSLTARVAVLSRLIERIVETITRVAPDQWQTQRQTYTRDGNGRLVLIRTETENSSAK